MTKPDLLARIDDEIRMEESTEAPCFHLSLLREARERIAELEKQAKCSHVDEMSCARCGYAR